MGFKTTYRTLFEMNVYHHYFLDDGSTLFDSSATIKEQQLEKYDMNDFLEIIPSEMTRKVFLGQKIVFKNTPSGFIVFIKSEENPPASGTYEPYVSLSQNTTFDFLVRTTDSLFENYSTVVGTPTIPFLFTNKKPSTEGGGFTYIDLETTTNLIEDFTISQSTFDALSNRFTSAEKIGLFAIISLEMAGDDTTIVDGNARNIVTVSGALQAVPKTFKIQLKNRSTIWNYRNASDSTLMHTTDPTELPLVKNGIIGFSFGGEERPSASPNRLIFEKDGSGTIIKTFSEIYIN